MPLTPEGLSVSGWIRRNLVLIIVMAMLLFQFLNWRALDRLADSMPRSPPRCSEYEPCSVYVKGAVTVQGNVGLDSTTIRLISK